ncbi:MAG: glycoside hydrolase family 5 protein [Hyphomicrobiales bacterium]|nr:glycoside hydrolase family 5 protein [Hyphomicrobiales bacterium]
MLMLLSRLVACMVLLGGILSFAVPCFATTEPVPSSQPSAVIINDVVERAEPTAPQTRYVFRQGTQFIAPDGHPVRLKGINLGNWLLPEGYMFKFDPSVTPLTIYNIVQQLIGGQDAQDFWQRFRALYVGRNDISFIKRAGFNSIRVPFDYRFFANETKKQPIFAQGYELLDKIIEWSGEAGLYVILDMHVAPGGQTGGHIDDSFGQPALFDDPANQRLAIRIWREIAERYRDEPTVLGFDLLNEPIAHFVDTGYYNPKLEPFYKEAVSAIRQVNQNHIIFLSGAQWGGNFNVFGEVFDDNVAYTFHEYWSDPTQTTIQKYLDFRRSHNVPLWLGESGQNTFAWIQEMRVLLEEHDIGWAFWPYKNLDSKASVMSFNQPENWQSIVEFANRYSLDPDAAILSVPPREVVLKALNDYLENVRFENVYANEEYLSALGLALRHEQISENTPLHVSEPDKVSNCAANAAGC